MLHDVPIGTNKNIEGCLNFLNVIFYLQLNLTKSSYQDDHFKSTTKLKSKMFTHYAIIGVNKTINNQDLMRLLKSKPPKEEGYKL